MSFDEIIDDLANIINSNLGGIMPLIEKYWMWLATFPIIIIALLIAHYGYGAI